MMKQTYKAAIFDLDGTLMDSLQDLYISTNYALQAMGYAARSLDEVRQFVGNGVGKLIECAVPQDTTQEQVAQCLSIFKAYYVQHCREHTAPYEDVVPMLRELKQRGIRTAIVSNKLQAGVDELYHEYFPGLIDVAIGEHPRARRKPHPDMVDQAVQQLGMQKADCLYIGDSEVDVQTARNAGLDCVAVLWGFRNRSLLEQAGATQFVIHPARLLGWF